MHCSKATMSFSNFLGKEKMYKADGKWNLRASEQTKPERSHVSWKLSSSFRISKTVPSGKKCHNQESLMAAIRHWPLAWRRLRNRLIISVTHWPWSASRGGSGAGNPVLLEGNLQNYKDQDHSCCHQWLSKHERSRDCHHSGLQGHQKKGLATICPRWSNTIPPAIIPRPLC